MNADTRPSLNYGRYQGIREGGVKTPLRVRDFDAFYADLTRDAGVPVVLDWPVPELAELTLKSRVQPLS